MDLHDKSVFDMVNDRSKAIEEKLKCDVIFYNGRVHPGYFKMFRDFIESVREISKKKNNGATKDTIAVFLRTPGGSVETAERMVTVLRNHYKHVYFIVPDVAMSAGTILCMAGDKIFMDYASSLGPIDPQIPASDTGEYVPALGYLDKVNEITEKGHLASADVILLKSLDLAKLALFEQARDLSIDLLKKWLVEYKFKDWKVHRTRKGGGKVTQAEKEARAEEIAVALADHKRWRSHGRNLDIKKLIDLRIEIDDYSDDEELKKLIREYNDPLTGFIDRMDIPFYLHNRHFGH